MSSFISSIGTAVPPHRISQSAICQFMVNHLPLSSEEKRQVEILYRASGIQYRHSVLEDYGKNVADFLFYPKNDALEPFPTVGQRMELYREHAIKLCMNAVEDCFQGHSLEGITHLITVSCTGMYAPGIDIELVEQLGLPTQVRRTAINFMGCYASFNALKVADNIIRSEHGSRVLIVAVELCSIHMLKKTDPDNLLSNALFGDGAAAVLVEEKKPGLQLEISSFYSDLETAGKKAMAWKISDFGFEMKLSAEVPDSIKRGISQLTSRLLKQKNLDRTNIDHFAIHPGGKRILEVIEEELGICREQNQAAYHVMKNYGNMSSPTVLFVLKELFDGFDEQNRSERILSFAFGPGLTLESMLLEVAL